MSGTVWSAGTVIFNDDLYMGTHNENGGEVWATIKPGGTWTAVSSPVTNTLTSVDMLSTNDGWAVGYEGTVNYGDPSGSVMLRWEGDTWTEWWTSPTYYPLFSVTTVSASDSWAVGRNSYEFSRILRWDGSAWNEVAHPTSLYSLYSVDMVSASDGWAVGGGGSCPTTGAHGTILHWDGSAWSLFGNVPDRVLKSVAMVSATDGWAVGYYCHPGSDYDSVILRWNGSSWDEVYSPTYLALNSVAMVSATDGWAVGANGALLHWNGSSWTWVITPTSCTLRSVSMVSAEDGWAVGGDGGYCPQPSVILHWDGSTWSELSSPVSQTLNSVKMISAGEGWAVGNGGTILHYTLRLKPDTDPDPHPHVYSGGGDLPPECVAGVHRSHPAPPLAYVGVNLAGADFGDNVLPGTYGYDYIYPNAEEVDYFTGKGMTIFRLPFRWERLQQAQFAGFDAAELARMDTFVNYATGQGDYVLLDPHNYARYYGDIIGEAAVPVSAFTDFWSRLADHYRSNSRVIFGLMNEPNNMSTELWVSDANAAIQAIRLTGATNLILVPGNAWSGASSWGDNWYGTPNAVAMLNITDSGNNYRL